MNKHKFLASFRAFSRLAHNHAHAAGATLCGVLIGIMFVSVIHQDQAKMIEDIPNYRPLPMVALLDVSEPPDPVVPKSSSSASSSAPSLRAAAIEVPVARSAQSSSKESSASSDSSSSSSSSSSVSSSRSAASFPAFGKSSFPVSRIPNWGAMRSASEWDRTHSEMTREDFVGIPRYNLATLTIPMDSLTNPITEENIPIITAKLFYSTRFMGTYDLDAGEHTGGHAGIDLKLARGTPVGAVGGGRVSSVTTSKTLGLHVIVEHRMQSGETFYSMYGHFDSAAVTEGQDIVPGQTVGYVGMTGNTSAPHLHLQIDRGAPGTQHVPNHAETVHPIEFIGRFRNGE